MTHEFELATKCADCNALYNFQDKHHLGAPLRLPCGHLSCDRCIRQQLKNDKRHVTCKECFGEIKLSITENFNVRQEFKVATDHIALLQESYTRHAMDESTIGFNMTANLVPVDDNTPSTKCCEECNDKVSELGCKQCQHLLCQPCFTKIHQANTLRNHDSIPIFKDGIVSFSDLEIENHEYNAKIDGLLQRCALKQNAVAQALENLQDTRWTNAAKCDTNIRKLVASNFEKAREMLQSAEDEIMAQLQSEEEYVKESVLQSDKELKELDHELKEMTKSIVTARKEKRCASPSLMEKLEELLLMPDTTVVECYSAKNIVLSDSWLKELQKKLERLNLGIGKINLKYNPINVDGEQLLNSELNVETSKSKVPSYILNKTSESSTHCSAQGLRDTRSRSRCSNSSQPSDCTTQYAVGNNTYVPKTYNENRMTNTGNRHHTSKNDDQPIGRGLAYRMKNNNYQSGEVISSTFRNPGKKLPYSPPPFELRMNHRYEVEVTWIESPSNFYVQLPKSGAQLEKFDKYIFNKLDPKLRIDSPSLIDKDSIYAAQIEGSWCRVKLVNDTNPSLVSYTAVDYGQTGKLPLTDCYMVPPDTGTLFFTPPLAALCGLYQCYPKDSATWSEDAIEKFKSFINNDPVAIAVHDISPMKASVELRVLGVGPGQMTANEYLVSSAKAQLQPISRHTAAMKIPQVLAPKLLEFYYDTDFRTDKWVTIEITHVETPDCFYVQRADEGATTKSFKEMEQKLNNFFNDKKNDKESLLRVEDLCPNMPVVAKFKEDKKWYRALLMGPAREKGILVQYVDYGNRDFISTAWLRRIPERFLENTVQAIHCGLMDVRPLEDKWSKEDTIVFAKLVKDEKLQMVVQVRLPDRYLWVSLFVKQDSTDNYTKPICVNEQLIEAGVGRGIGANTGVKRIEKNRNENLEDRLENKAEKLASEINGSSSVTEESVIEEEEIPPANTLTADGKFKVIVLSCINPNKIYVQLVNTVPKILELHEQMAKFFRDGKNDDLRIESVSNKMRCAVYLEKEKKWCRATVVEKYDYHDVKIFLSDYGRYEHVALKNIRILKEEFNKVFSAAISCSLVECEPEIKWDEDICEMLKEQISSYQDLYISKSRGSAPFSESKYGKKQVVDLWGRNTVCDGPLEPQKEVWTKINDVLWKPDYESDEETDHVSDLGIAKYVPPIEENVKLLEQVASNKSKGETIHEWLQTAASKATENSVVTVQITEENSAAVIDDNDAELEASGSTFDAGDRTDWLPPTELPTNQVTAIPSYVDHEFNIYFKICNAAHDERMARITDGLQAAYANSKPSPLEMQWAVGEICIAWYFLDSKWYRGRVFEVNKKENKVHVQYVDYGNIEWVDMKNTRKRLACKNIPIQCYKFPIRSDIAPVAGSDKWPVNVLEYVHTSIVEKVCQITFRMEENEDFCRIETVQTPADIEIFHLLYELNFLMWLPSKGRMTPDGNSKENDKLKLKRIRTENGSSSSSDSSGSIASVEDMSSVQNDLKYFQIKPTDNWETFSLSQMKQETEKSELQVSEFYVPNTKETFDVEITEVFTNNLIAVNILENGANMAIKENRKEFLAMNEELQRNAIKQPILEPPYIGRVCCTKFSDGKWYRAIVVEECVGNPDHVIIYYIDFGNIDTVELTLLHKMKERWFQVPAQAIKCTLEYGKLNLPLMDDNENKDEILSKLLLTKNFEARIEKSDQEEMKYTIELFSLT